MNQSPRQRESRSASEEVSWGPKLFFATLVAVLLFFYWLLIHAGGQAG